EDVVAFGLHGIDAAGLHAAHFLVVEGQVEGVRVLDQAVIADHRNAFGHGSGDGRGHGFGVLRQDDDGVGALRDEAFDVGQLLGGGRLGVGRDVLVAVGLDHGLHGGLVGLPALFLEVVPGDADDQVLGHG